MLGLEAKTYGSVPYGSPHAARTSNQRSDRGPDGAFPRSMPAAIRAGTSCAPAEDVIASSSAAGPSSRAARTRRPLRLGCTSTATPTSSRRTNRLISETLPSRGRGSNRSSTRSRSLLSQRIVRQEPRLQDARLAPIDAAQHARSPARVVSESVCAALVGEHLKGRRRLRPVERDGQRQVLAHTLLWRGATQHHIQGRSCGHCARRVWVGAAGLGRLDEERFLAATEREQVSLEGRGAELRTEDPDGPELGVRVNVWTQEIVRDRDALGEPVIAQRPEQRRKGRARVDDGARATLGRFGPQRPAVSRMHERPMQLRGHPRARERTSQQRVGCRVIGVHVHRMGDDDLSWTKRFEQCAQIDDGVVRSVRCAPSKPGGMHVAAVVAVQSVRLVAEGAFAVDPALDGRERDVAKPRQVAVRVSEKVHVLLV